MLISGSQDSEVSPLVNEGKLIQSIDFSGVELQRVGSTWRVLSKIPTLKIEQPEQYIIQWKQDPLELLTASPMVMDTAQTMPVVVWLAGQQEAAVYEFMIDATQQAVYVKQHQQERWFVMDYAKLSLFIPAELLKQ